MSLPTNPSLRRLNLGCFILEGLNSFATVYYSYYLYFFMQQEYGFDNLANLKLAALNGLVGAAGSLLGGKFAQKFGYFRALKLGFFMMATALFWGLTVHSAAGHALVMAIMIAGMGLTWPTLEALSCEGQTPAGVQRMVGIYNVIWSATAALAYFSGGALLHALGTRSLFLIPSMIQLVQLGFTFWLERQNPNAFPSHPQESPPAPGAEALDPVQMNPRPIARVRLFQRMSWLANPFAYIAINTLLAVMPGIAGKLGLSTALAGFCCSIWCFARLGAFIAFWRWNGWHYRFGWLLAAYLGLLGTFAGILTAPSVVVLIALQLAFGVAIGLIYYSSLFYSMEVSQTKGEHGGIHEAAIGLGNFAGPAVGAASLHYLPQHSQSGVLAVSGLLLTGLAALLAIGWSGSRDSSRN